MIRETGWQNSCSTHGAFSMKQTLVNGDYHRAENRFHTSPVERAIPAPSVDTSWQFSSLQIPEEFKISSPGPGALLTSGGGIDLSLCRAQFSRPAYAWMCMLYDGQLLVTGLQRTSRITGAVWDITSSQNCCLFFSENFNFLISMYRNTWK